MVVCVCGVACVTVVRARLRVWAVGVGVGVCACVCVCVRACVFAGASRVGSTRIRCREQTTRDQVSVLLEKLKHLPFEMKVDYEIAIEAK